MVINTSGVKGLLGKFQIGDTLHANTYDTFNLVNNKDVGVKGETKVERIGVVE